MPSAVVPGRFFDNVLAKPFIQGNTNKYFVMALSGHKDISMLKRYSHTREDTKKGAIKKLENHLNFVGEAWKFLVGLC